MLDATGCHHWASIATQMPFFCVFSSSTCRKRSRVDAKAPVFNRGMTWYGACMGEPKYYAINLILRLFLYHFLHTMSL
jgi:hypothetical protein